MNTRKGFAFSSMAFTLVIVAIAASLLMVELTVNKTRPSKNVVTTPVYPTGRVMASQLGFDPTRTAFVYGPVLPETVEPAIKKMRELDDGVNPIFFLIKTPGGSILSGNELILAMRAMKSPIVCIVDFAAYSMGAGIFLQGCSIRYMTDQSSIMNHQAQYQVSGYETWVVSRVNSIQFVLKEMHQANADALKEPLAPYMEKVVREYWLTDQQLFNRGVIKGIVVSLNFDYGTSTEELDQLNNKAERIRKTINNPWYQN